ncbi:MAG: hypothetical protein AAFU41_04515 [Pseudomonadota bacterium]
MRPAIGQVIYGIDGRDRFALTPLDDAALFATGADADQMLAASVAGQEGLIGAEDLGALPIVDYELMLARLGTANFGDIVAQNVTCKDCGKRYAVEFSLGTYADLIAAEVIPHQGGAFQGHTLRLPSRDSLVKAGPNGPLPVLWDKSGKLAQEDVDAVEAYLSKACPVLQEDIPAACPECDATHHIRFVLRDWIGARLAARYKSVVAQVHLLASAYHWHVDQILALSRTSRMALVQAIRTQRGQTAPLAAR